MEVHGLFICHRDVFSLYILFSLWFCGLFFVMASGVASSHQLLTPSQPVL